MNKLTVTAKVALATGREGKKEIRVEAPRKAFGAAKVPRVARLMALAIKFEQMVVDGDVKDYAEIAWLGHVTRARMSQIMNLLNLAPDLQERVLCLSAADVGKDRITERSIRTIIKQTSWRRQRLAWSTINDISMGSIASDEKRRVD